MKKYLLVFLIVLSGLLSVGECSAETVSQKEALKIAGQFFNAANGNVMAPPKLVFNGRKLTTGRLFSPYYIYNHPTGGFVIISAENKAFPILGYSLKDSFNPNNIDDSLRALLTLYAMHIEKIRYDSQEVPEAVKAWTDLPHYIDSLLNSPYNATDRLIEPDEARNELYDALEGEAGPDLYSDIYSADQWNSLIDSQLATDKNVVMGVLLREDAFPIILQGNRAGMYRIGFKGLDRALFCLLPTEILTAGEVAVLSSAPGKQREEEPDSAFRFYDDFVKEVNAENALRQSKIENALIPQTPIVRPAGSGFFTIDMPDDPVSSRVYNAAGMLVKAQTYRDTPSAFIDISAAPRGFYFAIIFTKNGKSYGVKLYK